MWFRLNNIGGNASNGDRDSTPTNTTDDAPSPEMSKFQKFRRSSFRRKTQTPKLEKMTKKDGIVPTNEQTSPNVIKPQRPQRKRNKSPPIFYKVEPKSNLQLNELVEEESELMERKDLSKTPPVQFKSNLEMKSESSESSDSDSSSENDDSNNVAVMQRGLKLSRSKTSMLLTDRKYKNNRIEKSSSKSKVNDSIPLGHSLSRSRSSRKMLATNSKNGNNSHIKLRKDLSRDKLAATEPAEHQKNTQVHSTLNLQAIVKFVMNNKKLLASDDFSLIRGKSSLTKRRTNPIALKFSLRSAEPQTTGVVAVAPQDCDAAKTDKNVMLLKSSKLKASPLSPLNTEKSKSTNELDGVGNEVQKSRKSSPSLTSRVAAKISSKKHKSLQNVQSTIPDTFRQLSGERVSSSTSIVRQPSDRRPDANISLRSNGNASSNTSALNSSDLQSSYHAGQNANDSINASGGGPSFSADLSNAGMGSGALSNSLVGAVGAAGIAESNASDAPDKKDARKERYQHKSAPVSVNRSESYKERLSSKRSRSNRRKTSDPSLSSRPNDDQPDLGLSNANYTASSNSSLSSGGGAGSESPSTSMEQVAGGSIPGAGGATAGNLHQHPHLLIQQHAYQHSQQDSFQSSVGSSSASNTSFWNSGHQMPPPPLQRQWNFESDDEDDLNEADWSSMVAAEMLAALTDAEKKRQEIINEIYQTERNHVRTLKLLDRLFFLPLYESGLLPHEHLLLLFPPALLSLRELHGNFEQKLKLRRVEHNHVVTHIGDLLADMFDGQSGEVLREYAAQFCARQQIALEGLKEKRHKDEQLQKLLKKSESHKACRRLELKDLLPTVLQRLTKYPLLFENLHKVTIRVVPENKSEAEAIQRALESSKEILVEVNKAVKTAEDAHKLQNIQRKLDRSSYDKDKDERKLDLTQHRLIHDGNLTMKKNPSILLHGLLFENMIVLLTKQDDKYLLKNLHTPGVNNKPVSPIMNIDSETLVRQEAADKNSFFLIKTKTSQMLELRAPSSSECKTWFKHISDAAAHQYKPRPKNSANSHDTTVDEPSSGNLPHSHTKESSLDLTPDRVQPMAATATMTTTPLAPLLPIATVTPAPIASSNSSYDGGVQLRSTRRDSTPSDNVSYYNITDKQRLSHQEAGSSGLGSSSVSRSMSIRSCGESNNNYADNDADHNGVILRHTQSARESNNSNASEPRGDERISSYGLVGGHSKRDSASIVCSNNSNNTRTLLMQSPLVDPAAIQISISPAHTAEPVLTPGERLRRLDSSIRDGLLEKQKIICDIFRLPVEHFNEIVDIAMMPEAPKDSADIALAAYDQVQMLTKILNEYMRVTPEQEVSAVSTAVCSHCHEKEKHRKIVSHSPSPPPLPPPNKQHAQAQAQPQIPLSRMMPKLHTHSVDDVAIHEDDDGYCEIDELRLPAITTKSSSTTDSKSTPTATPLAPLKSSESSAGISNSASNAFLTTENVSVEPVDNSQNEEIKNDSATEIAKNNEERESETAPASAVVQAEEQKVENIKDTDIESKKQEEITKSVTETPLPDTDEAAKANDSNAEVKISDVYETMAALNKAHATISMIDNSTQTAQSLQVSTIQAQTQTISEKTISPSAVIGLGGGSSCGPNRIQHASSLEPSVPCHALSSIVGVLNEQISLLLPKINERDMERERLRKENQHLRELLSAMHERKQVDAIKETPTDIMTILQAADAEFEDDLDSISNTSLTPTPTPIPTTPPISASKKQKSGGNAVEE
ncbi:uncharacterized protein LOC6640155 isoform X4 [Drosophila willistoni]|uniref:uncharacterized protein LOC6640155 isoform X4 n=1 Tax=Drosophila willistoni TaxID=7260 RepID=UPI000C26CB19|nr:uncharacterized protein LOC6640155 isoform X4 [Drosophila willistoni]